MLEKAADGAPLAPAGLASSAGGRNPAGEGEHWMWLIALPSEGPSAVEATHHLNQSRQMQNCNQVLPEAL
jgi:hypothetical protein